MGRKAHFSYSVEIRKERKRDVHTQLSSSALFSFSLSIAIKKKGNHDKKLGVLSLSIQVNETHIR